jgi:hypothetical protein
MRGSVETLPGSQTRVLWALALFAAIQLADGVMTTSGIAKYGASIEGNPLLRFVAASAGFGMTLLVAKLAAITFAALLQRQEMHLTLAVLTVAYVAAAILPWTFVLALS